MGIKFHFIGQETSSSIMVGQNCGDPTDLSGLSSPSFYNWHFRIEGITDEYLYPRELVDPTTNGRWFNPARDSQRSDDKCNNNSNWPMHVVQTPMNGTYTWDLYVAPYLASPRVGEVLIMPYPTTEYSVALYVDMGEDEDEMSSTLYCRIPGLWYNDVVDTPITVGIDVVTVGTDCADPENNDVATNWEFAVSGIVQADEFPLRLEETTAVSNVIWEFNSGLCTPNNYRPMGRSPESAYEPGSDDTLVTWKLYVTPAPGAIPGSNAVYALEIYNPTTQTSRYESWYNISAP